MPDPTSPATPSTPNVIVIERRASRRELGLIASGALGAMLVAGYIFGEGPKPLPPHAAGVADGECLTVDECDAMGGEVVEGPAPLVGPGFVDSFSVNCLRTAATKIQAPCGQVSYAAHVPAAATANVVFGDDAIAVSSGGETIEADGRIGANVRYEYCRTTLDAGVAVEVRSMCSSVPADFEATAEGEVEWRGGVDGDRVPPPPCYPGSPYECKRGR